MIEIVLALFLQVVPPVVYVGPATKVAFDWNGKDANDKPETAKESTLALFPDSVTNPAQGGTALKTQVTPGPITGKNIVPNLVALLTGTPDGQYGIAAMITDQAGNLGGWSVIWKVKVDTTPPTAPTNLRIEIEGVGTLDIAPDGTVTGTLAGKVVKNP